MAHPKSDHDDFPHSLHSLHIGLPVATQVETVNDLSVVLGHSQLVQRRAKAGVLNPERTVASMRAIDAATLRIMDRLTQR